MIRSEQDYPEPLLFLHRDAKAERVWPLTADLTLKRITPATKRKSPGREPEYFRERVCVCACVFYMWVWALNVPCRGVWKRPDAGCQAFLRLSPLQPVPSRSLTDDGWQRMRSFLSWTADWSRLPVEEQPSAFHWRGEQRWGGGWGVGFGPGFWPPPGTANQGGLSRNEATHL